LIGIITEKENNKIVTEFFQLFKTPWEFYQKGHSYDVIFTTGELNEDLNVRIIVIFGSDIKKVDSKYNITLETITEKVILNYNNILFPIYKGIATFKTEKKPIIKIEGSSRHSGIEITTNEPRRIRIGYNLFEELEYILTSGQPKKYATIPTVEIHIQILRDLIIQSGLPFIEIPPVPEGYDFITCLTHDVDFGGIRNYKFDHTMYGFIYRSLFVSIINFFKKKITYKKLLTNLKAAFSLPCVYLGLIKDFWIDFYQYIEIEKDLKSTYFFLPYKKQRGMIDGRRAPSRRASKCDILDLKSYVEDLKSQGHEIGLHGIDAWHDTNKGVEEFSRISTIAGISEIGVRIHWLYFNEDSPMELEKAGFYYDTTIGYNDAVGYAAGTTQVFCPLRVERLFEIPMHIMDTALFYTGRMALREEQAILLCTNLINNSVNYGGVLVINWHQRSLAPERLWVDFYIRLINLLKEHRVWFATCEEAVRWFEQRRKVQFEDIRFVDKTIKLRLTCGDAFIKPGMTVRIYNLTSEKLQHPDMAKGIKSFIDIPCEINKDIEINFPNL